MMIRKIFSRLRALLTQADGVQGAADAESITAGVFSLLMLLLFPLYLRGGYRRATDAKAELWYFLCAAAALVLLLLRLRRKRLSALLAVEQGTGHNIRHRIPALNIAARRVLRREHLPRLLLGGWLLLAFISSLCSDYGWQTVFGLGGNDGLLVQTLLLLMLLFLSRGRGWRDSFPAVAAVCLLLLCLLGRLQLAGYDPLGLYPEGYDYYDGGVRYVGQFLSGVGNIDMLAAVFCLLLPLCVMEPVCGRSLLCRGLALLAAVAAVALLLRLGTEAALLGLLTAALCTALVLTGRLPQRMRRIFILAAVILLLSALLWVYNYHGAEQGSLWELSRILHGDIRDEFGSRRVQIWRAALECIRDRPWLGSGCGTEKGAFALSFSRVVEETGSTLSARVTRAHSEYLSYALELGIPAALLYIAALLLTLLRGWRAALRRWDARLFALCASLTAYAVQAMFNYRSIVIGPLLFCFWAWLLELTEQGDLRYDED